MKTLNFESKSPLLPSFNIKFFDNILDAETTKQLADLVLLEEENIINGYYSNPNLIDKLSENDSNEKTWLTGKLWWYNFLDFDYPCVKKLNNFIFDSYKSYMENIGVDSSKPVYVQCWANIIRNNGRIISPHNHVDAHCNAPWEYCYVSANLSVQTEDTCTYFSHPIIKEIATDLPNINGQLIMFPSWTTHWTSKNLSDNPRVTISCDIITEEVYNMETVINSNYRLLTLRN
jgi:hypothetical protein